MVRSQPAVREAYSLLRKGRKGLLLLLIGTVAWAIVSCPMVGSAQGADLAKGLLGHWKFDGDVANSSPGGQDGVAHGDPEFVPGKIGRAIKLDGKSQYVEVAKLASDVTQFTLAAWMHVDGMPAPEHLASIYHNNGWEVGDVHLPFAGPKGVMDLGIKGNEPSMSVPTFQVKDLQKRWVHLAVAYDADAGKDVSFYVDGKRTDHFKIKKAGPVRLGPGRIGTWDVDGRWFNGLLDEMYMYKRALSAEDVKAMYELGSK